MRTRLLDDMEDDDPILSVVNLIDVFLVIIAALTENSGYAFHAMLGVLAAAAGLIALALAGCSSEPLRRVDALAASPANGVDEGHAIRCEKWPVPSTFGSCRQMT